jgi:hypothetical protein
MRREVREMWVAQRTRRLILVGVVGCFGRGKPPPQCSDILGVGSTACSHISISVYIAYPIDSV